MRVLAAMSGGVDSAVAAALAVEAGHDVTGVHLALSPDRQTLRSGARGCCSVEDAHDARRVADELGIPFYVWDLAERFRDDVVDDFVAEYAAGRTPNPCLRCNEKIKFTAVLDRARALGFDAVGQPGVVAGDDGVEAQCLRPVEDGGELDLLVAAQARVGGAAGRVLGHEVVDDIVREPVGEVPDVERDAQLVGDPPGVVRVLDAAAAARAAAQGLPVG